MLAALLALAFAGGFLALDSALAIAFGKRYMLWGLEYTPGAYSSLIRRISGLPAPRLLAIKAVELIAGIACLAISATLFLR